MSARSLDVEARTERGKNESRRLRRSGYIPGVVYSHGKVENIKVKKTDFFKLFKGRISESIIFDLNFMSAGSGATQMAFIKDYQRDPVTDEIMHLDFFKVTADEKISTAVPIELVGAPKGVKMGGHLEITERVIEVECLPKDLPEKITVDISDLDIGQSIHAKGIALGENIRLKSNPDAVIAGVHVARAVEEVVAEAEAVEGEVAEAGEEAAASDEDEKKKDKKERDKKEKEE